jgi:hypothetical protein
MLYNQPQQHQKNVFKKVFFACDGNKDNGRKYTQKKCRFKYEKEKV